MHVVDIRPPAGLVVLEGLQAEHAARGAGPALFKVISRDAYQRLVSPPVKLEVSRVPVGVALGMAGRAFGTTVDPLRTRVQFNPVRSVQQGLIVPRPFNEME